MNARQRFLMACKGQPVDRPPLWIMRQAGRTLPEYRALREKHSFWETCRNPELATEVSLQPIRRFQMDAAVIFSDILVVPAAMGMEVEFTPKLAIYPRIENVGDLTKLQYPDVSKSLGYVGDVIREVRRVGGDELAIVGFCGAPYTLLSYMVEGGSSKHFDRLKGLMYREPELFASLMRDICEYLGDFLQMQAEAGADALQIFDTWATILGPRDYAFYVLPYLQKLIARIRAKGIPLIYYINGIGNLLELARDTGADVLGIDWRIELAEVRQRLGKMQIVQGNLDPGILFADPDFIAQRVHQMIDQTGGRGHIINLGHGVIPETPISGIQAFIDAARSWMPKTERVSSEGLD